MNRRAYWLKMTGIFLALLGLLGGQLSPAFAAMTSTDSVLEQQQRSVERAEVLEMLDRESVQAQLQELGVDAEAAKQRVAAMTDEEIRQLNAHLAEMPAGGDVLGVVLVVFIVFIITDMLGATDIFPFVNPINR
ncbi:MAG: DUF6627 family protein [Pseudomonadota bacterium]